jgi:peptidoglycan/LPS O-acetylase OafA/YrhL
VGVALLIDWPGLSALRADVISAIFWMANWEQLGDTGYWESFTPSLTRHFWSLSFEEQVYIAFPLFVALVVVISRSIPKLRGLPLAVPLSLGSGLLVVGSWILLWTNSDPSFLYLSTWTRLGEIAFGMLAAGLSHLFSQRRLSTHWASAVILIGMSFAAPFWIFSAGNTVGGVRWGITMATPATAVVIAMLWRYPESLPSKFFSLPVSAWLGRRAYGIYLLHLPIIEFMAFGLGVRQLPAWAMVVAVAGTIAGAGLMFRWLEEPIRVGQWLSSGRVIISTMAVSMVAVTIAAFALVAVVDETFTVDTVDAPPAELLNPPGVIDTDTDDPSLQPSEGALRRVALVVGDSTAWVTQGAVAAALAPAEWSSHSVHMVGCPFGGDVRLKSSVGGGAVNVREIGDEPGCDLWWNSLLGEWQRTTQPTVIVIVGGYGLAYEIDPEGDSKWCRLGDGSGRCEQWAEARLAAMTERLREESPDALVVWTTPGHIDPYGPLDIPRNAIDVLDRLIRAEADRHGDAVIDLGSWLDDNLDLTVDGTHLGPDGVRTLIPWMIDNLVPLVPGD